MKMTASKNELKTIRHIVDRAVRLGKKRGIEIGRIDTEMDLIATHANGCKLKLDELLAADDFNFSHDVFGIQKHLDRSTGKLTGFFLPRFSA